MSSSSKVQTYLAVLTPDLTPGLVRQRARRLVSLEIPAEDWTRIKIVIPFTEFTAISRVNLAVRSRRSRGL